MKKVVKSLMEELKDKPKAGTALDPQIEEVFSLEKNDILLAIKDGYEIAKITKVLQKRYEPQFTKRVLRGGKEGVVQITPVHLIKYLEKEGVDTKNLVVSTFKRPNKAEIARQVEIVNKHRVEILKKHVDNAIAVDEIAKQYGVSKHYIQKAIHNEA